MGSSLSGALANIVMVDLETTALSAIPPEAVHIYTRYVDDIFAYLLKRFLDTSTSPQRITPICNLQLKKN